MFRKVLFRFAVACLTLAAISSLYFFMKTRERVAYVNELVRSTLPDGKRTEPQAAAIALSQAIYRRTNKTANADELDGFSRWESESPFNVTAGASLRYGIYGIEGHSVEGACGTMSRTLLNALWTLDIPARKLQLLDNASGVGVGVFADVRVPVGGS